VNGVSKGCGCDEIPAEEEYVCGCIHCPRCDEWVLKEDHRGKEFDNGVCGQCSCIECGNRLDHDDLNEDTCEHCSEIDTIKFDRRDAEGFCNWCDKEKAAKRYVDKRGMGVNLCNVCYEDFTS